MADVNIKSFEELSSVSDTDIAYVISKDTEDNDKDFQTSLLNIKKYVIGEENVLFHQIKEDTVILTVNPENKSQLCKYSDLEVCLFGERTDEFSINNDILLRSFKADNSRGFISVESLRNFIYVDDVEMETIGADISSLNVRFNNIVGGISTLSRLSLSKLRDWIYGSDIFTTIENTDKFNFSSDTKRGTVTFDVVLNTLLPNRNIISSDEVNDNLRLYATSTERGYIKVETLRAYLTEKLNLPNYSLSDADITDNTTFAFFEGEGSGKASINKLYSILFKDTALELTVNTQFRVVGGIVSYSSMEDKMYDRLSEVFKIDVEDQLTDINDGDNFVIVENNSIGGEYKGISFLTVKNKILDSDTHILDLNDTDRIYIIRDDQSSGYVTFSELRDKLNNDIFG